MVFAAAIVILLNAVLLFLAAKEQIPSDIQGIFKPFYRAAQYLYKLICIWKISFPQEAQVETDLKKVFPTQGKEQLKTRYYIKKIALGLLIILIGTFFAMLVSIKSGMNPAMDDSGAIVRGSFTEEELVLDIAASAAGKKQIFQVQVAPRQLSESEIESYYEEFVQELPQLILGENISLQQVSSDLQLLEEYEGYPFSVEWISKRPDIVSGSGKLYSCEEKTQVILTAEISYADREWEEPFTVHAVPAVLSAEEQAYEELKTLLQVSEQETRMEDTWQLPEIWQGNTLEWKQVREDYGYLLWITSIITAIAVYFLSDRDLHEKAEEQKRRMKKEYPDIVHKLVLYLGAGLTVRGAFQKIAMEYEKEDRNEKKKRPAYEEMLFTCRELQAGVSEGAAYEHFGKRTGLQEYVRLSTLLMQNLKKGNSALLNRLREESARAYEEQLHNSRRLAEEAVTKLLLPMILLLMVVMVMIMIPAFWSMGA